MWKTAPDKGFGGMGILRLSNGQVDRCGPGGNTYIRQTE
jgi:hypothetical protein